MRFAFLCFAVYTLFLTACVPEENDAGKQATVEHNARNSLDFVGAYNHTPAVKDAEIKNIALLGTDRFRIITGDGSMKVGRFTWDETGNFIILEGRQVKKLVLFVGENHLKIMSDGPEKGRVFQKYQ